MKIKIVYFARLRDNLASSGEELELPSSITKISELRAFLASRGGKWSEAFDGSRTIRSSINFDLIADDADLIDSSEVAFFPPITGG
jgi:sulfur-carrier protein